ncbi:hypothetical protein ASPVEDRAFT_38617 [Aspergillus versicolor CBS 583.65]|uniref:Urease accessory protein UreD n=1 Tax=Aspergillus versicolor CBS 583.65 TaxID=1036611 RepID=A0A1L9PCB0_ASPVE|nr:uncharacterized protein ASPVEDRAFT_38617 [Aspergillus versicolor CBS 583.65]OJI99146.1 hypothetical protein ASPVEDRAFT_38617 [Aspergillus versicolor CBS 583.65]
MPHKHKRRQKDSSTYDLPPTLIAKSLPVRDPSKEGNAKGKGKGKGRPNANNKNQKPQPKDGKGPKKQKEAATSRHKSDLDDDTPRAFRQLMQFQAKNQAKAQNKRKHSGYEDDSVDSSSDDSGNNAPAVSRKAKTKQAPATSTQTNSTGEKNQSATAPKILPGEKLSDFAARVDREMPLANMKRSSKPTASTELPKIRDHRVTKHEKHLKRLQAQWRKDDARIKEREAAEREEKEEEMEEQLQLWKSWEVEAGKKKKNPNQSGGKKRKGGDDDDGPDPWAKLKKKRATVNPFEVAQEPPQLKKPREIFKVRGGAKVDVANVPASVGSLRRREELASERRNIVDEYRRLMAEKRGE